MPHGTQDWYEVWADEGLEPPYILVVLGYADGTVSVCDPKEDKIVCESDSYEAARLWLLEDEYTRVNGRMDDAHK